MTTVPQNKGKWSKKWQHCSCVWCVRSKDFLFRKVYWGSQIFLLLTYGIKGTVKYTFLETDTIEMILIFLESFVVDMIQKTVKPVPTQPVWRREEEAEVGMKVIDVCQNGARGSKQKFLEVIDSVHMLGKKTSNQSTSLRCHPAIPHLPDTTWSGSCPNPENSRQKYLCFKQDVAPEVSEKQKILWPVIQQGR